MKAPAARMTNFFQKLCRVKDLVFPVSSSSPSMAQ